MTIPSRLLDQAVDFFERDALRSAAMDRGSDQALTRALGAFSGTASASLAAVPVAKASGGLLLFKGIAAGVALGVCCALVTHAIGQRSVSHATEPVTRQAGVTQRPAASVAAAPSSLPLMQTSELPLLSATPSKATVDSAASAGRSKLAPVGIRPAEQSSLAYEIELLDLARRNLAQGNPAAALAALDRRQVEIPSGALGPEATVLRVEALLRSGDRNAAAALANGFLAQNPSGPHAVRIRRLLGDTIP